ncbi:zf-HC2 domain-containing protein [Actinoplanes sp. GCM10030250]|uniref:zf-HC2 domain-containing protein n=1 Tax=Actinoplanes sp. GCM10030250 TaxID=3273376 RepID=UPI00360B66CF
MTYHATDAQLLAWVEGGLDEAGVWSVEAHLERCGTCRTRIPYDEPAGPPPDLPPQGRVRRPTRARRIQLLIGAGPQARVAWLSAVLVTVALTLAVTWMPDGTAPRWLLLMIAPALPVLGTAASYGPRTDPLDELVGSTVYGGLRIVLWRTLSVLAVSLPVAAAGGLATGLGAPAVWLLPCCALTALTLALATLTGPAVAGSVVGTGWFVLVAGTLWSPERGAQLVTTQTTPVWLALIVIAAVTLTHQQTNRGQIKREAHR